MARCSSSKRFSSSARPTSSACFSIRLKPAWRTAKAWLQSRLRSTQSRAMFFRCRRCTSGLNFGWWRNPQAEDGSLPTSNHERFSLSSHDLQINDVQINDIQINYAQINDVQINDAPMTNADRTQREYPERPIVGVGAVIVDERSQRVVLVRRTAPPLQGQWSLPGGVVELGETLRAAAEREALEETGLVVKADEVLEVLDRIIPGADGRTQFHYVLVDFGCRVCGGELRAGGDAAEVAWAGENELARFRLEGPASHVIMKAFTRRNG